MGAIDVDVAEYKAFAAKLKQSDKKVAAAIRKQVRDAGKPLIDGVIADGPEGLPKRGGLGEWLRQSKGSLSMTQTRMTIKLQRGGSHDLAAINRGRLRHPVHGNRRLWVNQSVATGTYDAAIDRHSRTSLDQIEQALGDAMEELA